MGNYLVAISSTPSPLSCPKTSSSSPTKRATRPMASITSRIIRKIDIERIRHLTHKGITVYGKESEVAE
jgi:hypothetical protein